jgi:hypothetical protein
MQPLLERHSQGNVAARWALLWRVHLAACSGERVAVRSGAVAAGQWGPRIQRSQSARARSLRPPQRFKVLRLADEHLSHSQLALPGYC